MTGHATTAFALLCDRCGLTLTEAARYLETDEETVLGWSSGNLACSDHIIAQLRLLYRQISATAEQAMRRFASFTQNQGSPAEVEVGLVADDATAQRLGLPCIGAHRAALGMVIARSHGTRFVLLAPEGSGEASAALKNGQANEVAGGNMQGDG
jgi:hypothetical protein